MEPQGYPRHIVETRNQRRNAEKRWLRTKKGFNRMHADLTKAVKRLTRKQAQQLQFDAKLRPSAKEQQRRGIRYIGGVAMTMRAIQELASAAIRLGKGMRHAV